jgi:hypothetical protein
MSADNGVYIHKFRNGWRVVHSQCVENIYWNPGKDGYNHKELRKYFAGSPLFSKEEYALAYATKLYKDVVGEFGYVEYGIKIV